VNSRRRRLEQGHRQFLGILTEMRHEPRDERQRDGDVATEHVTQRQIRNRAMLPVGEGRIMADEVGGCREMGAVGDQRTLGMAGGTRGVDDESRLRRTQSLDAPGQPRQIRLARCRDDLVIAAKLRMRIVEHRRVVDDHDTLERWQPIDERQDLVDMLLILGNEQARAAVVHLIGDLGHGGGRIDAVDDAAERLGRQIAHQPLLARVAHDGDAIAGRDTERVERPCGPRDESRIVAPSPLAVEPEMLGAERNIVRLVARMLQQQARRGAGAQDLDIRRHHHRPPDCITLARKFYRPINNCVPSWLSASSADAP